MSRKKVKLQWIANDAARRATFKKRRKGLLKKVQELSILCDIKACMVVYGPYDPQPEVWPSGGDEAAALLRGFRRLPEHEQSRRRLDQEGFLRLRAEKMREQIEKEKKASRELQVELLFAHCLNGARKVEDLPMEETTALACLVEMKLKEVNAKLDSLRGQQTNSTGGGALASPIVAPLQPLPPVDFLPEGGGGACQRLPELYMAAAEGMRRPDWIMEMMVPYSHLFYDGNYSAPPLMDDGRSSWTIDPYFPFH
ncbi:unnamed protein product [Spirodela intermedia]|uniref:MADS-box domain-containing protein n=1 Tax=Spirodela intermedia TaxID=51605 RepID=A0ABN7EBT0_SPIIN|nr:unnamed protein product [Spirodela intermedia]